MKKRYLGIACAALVGGALVACGSGDVSKPSSEDEGNTVIFDSSYYVNRLDEATKACEADPVCAARMNGTSSVEVSSSSSSEIIEPESSPGSSSSVVPVPGSRSTFRVRAFLRAPRPSGAVLRRLWMMGLLLMEPVRLNPLRLKRVL